MHAYYTPPLSSHQLPSQPATTEWQSSQYLYDSPTETSSPMSLSYSPEANHAYFHPTAVHQQSSWDQQTSIPPHVEGYSSLNAGHALSTHTLDAAMGAVHGQPPTTVSSLPSSTSHNLGLPTIRRREHMRTRSGPSTWLLDHHSSTPTQYRVSASMQGLSGYHQSVAQTSAFQMGPSRDAEARGYGNCVRH